MPKIKVKTCSCFNYFHIACKVCFSFSAFTGQVCKGAQSLLYPSPLTVELIPENKESFKCKFCSLQLQMILQEVFKHSGASGRNQQFLLSHLTLLFQCLSSLEITAAKLFPPQNCFMIFSALCMWFFERTAVLRKTQGSKY